MSDRGMKKWAPYSSLIEQSTVLNEMFYEKNKKSKPQISNERANKINQIFANYGGESVRIKYFYDGYIYEVSIKIKKIDTLNKKLIFEEGSMPFSEIIDIKLKSL